MTEPSDIECAFCDNRVPVDIVEGFVKYAVINPETFDSYSLCRSCFELAYRGAPRDHRNWVIGGQCLVVT